MQMNNVIKSLRKQYPYGHPDFIPMCIDEVTLHSFKNHDFARGKNPLGNFYRVSQALTKLGFPITPAMVGLIYAFKQLDAAIQMEIRGFEGEVEDFDKRMEDLGIYAKIIRILHKEQRLVYFPEEEGK